MRPMTDRIRRCWPALALVCSAGAPVSAQDSVALVPGDSDALSVYTDPVTSRYVVDLVTVTSSWGNTYRIGPVLKSSADPDPMFATHSLGSLALSPNQELDVAPVSPDFAVWTTPGAGINPVANSAPSTVSVLTFDRRFGLSLSDFSSTATNVIGALIGQHEDSPERLFVTRVVGLSSRPSIAADDTATLSLGGIDASGLVALRADDFNAPSSAAVLGENVLTVDLLSRSGAVNVALSSAGTNLVADVPATSFVIDDDTITTNTPAMAPSGIALALNFANSYRAGGAPGVSTHLDPGVDAHRGNPSFSSVTDLGGVGVVGSLARTLAPDRTNALNLFAIDGSGNPVATRSAVLPSPVSDGVFSTNLGGDAEFHQYLSQQTFRGGNGQVAIGTDAQSGHPAAAVVGSDPTDGEFVAVAVFAPGSETWTVAAYAGKEVLDANGGSPIGTIATGSPVTFSGPAMDLNGNVYFVAPFQPTVGMERTAFFRAVNTPSGYELERLLETGESFAGANSGRSYTVDSLVLGDSDSVASGSVFSASVLQPRLAGATPSDPLDPASFGGAVLSARLIYNNGGTPEPYDAVLFLGPDIVISPFCTGDANGDGMVNFGDITAILGNWLNMYAPGSAGEGDSNNDGIVDFADVTDTLANWLAVCP